MTAYQLLNQISHKGANPINQLIRQTALEEQKRSRCVEIAVPTWDDKQVAMYIIEGTRATASI